MLTSKRSKLLLPRHLLYLVQQQASNSKSIALRFRKISPFGGIILITTYSPATTKGKIVVIKCWYIGCVACAQEFSEVNKLVDGYKDWDDILFVSLAMDGKEELVDFLKSNELKYVTVPNMEDLMQSKLGIGSYPTHLLLDRAGKIVKVVDRIDELKPFLEKQAATSL